MTGIATGPGERVVIAAGGTGGHVFPALALARGLAESGLEPRIVTDRRGTAFGGALGEVRCHTVRAGRLAGGPLATAAGGAALAAGFWQARRLLRRLAPAAAVGFGGYASVPPVAAASSLRVPVVVHEANAVLGRANRWLARRAAAVATGFPDPAFAGAPESVHTGVPVREAFAEARARAWEPPARGGPIRLLAVGGSQGARILGRVVPSALAALPEALRRRLQVDQQCRPEDEDAARRVYADAGIEARVRPFIDDMAACLAGAHLVIARAGASTIAELAAVGRPAILVPYARAADDHQTANARAVAAAGAGWLAPEDSLDAAALADRVARLLDDPAALARAAAAARAFGRPDSAELLVALVLRVCRGREREAGR